jgi:hypothetical protein
MLTVKDCLVIRFALCLNATSWNGVQFILITLREIFGEFGESVKPSPSTHSPVNECTRQSEGSQSGQRIKYGRGSQESLCGRGSVANLVSKKD